MSMSYPERTAFFWWSRELPPYYLAIAGLHHPLREPYLPLSKYTALSLFGQKKLIDCELDGGSAHTLQVSFAVLLTLRFPTVLFL